MINKYQNIDPGIFGVRIRIRHDFLRRIKNTKVENLHFSKYENCRKPMFSNFGSRVRNRILDRAISLLRSLEVQTSENWKIEMFDFLSEVHIFSHVPLGPTYFIFLPFKTLCFDPFKHCRPLKTMFKDDLHHISSYSII